MSTRRPKLLVIFAVIAVAAVSVGAYRYYSSDDPGSDILAAAGGGGGSSVDASYSEWTGEPLFSFGNLYLDGRSSWCRTQFESDRASLMGAAPVEKPIVGTTLHREPFTTGAWVERLSDLEARERSQTESQGVEIRAQFVVRGISALDLIVFLLTSDFRTKLPEDPAASSQTLFPGAAAADECLETIPSLDGNHVMTREHWPAGFQRKGSDVWFLTRVGRDGEVLYYVYEAWKNCPREGSFVNIKMSTGQYAISQRGDDCLVHVHTYYSGQGVPNIPFLNVDRLVADRSQAFYQGVADTLQVQAPGWEPREDALRWRDGLEL